MQAATSSAMRFPIRHDASRLTDGDLYLFNEGNHFHLYDKLGARRTTVDGQAGTFFSVWAPNAERVAVIGDFNGWSRTTHPLHSRAQSGVWEGFIAGLGTGAIYKYFIQSRHHGYRVEKADPFAFHAETPPKTGSVVWDLDYHWNDHEWMTRRHQHNALEQRERREMFVGPAMSLRDYFIADDEEHCTGGNTEDDRDGWLGRRDAGRGRAAETGDPLA